MAKLLVLAVFACLCALSSSALIDKLSKVKSYFEQQWFVDHVPFIEIPDASVEQMYYYRASVLRRHVRYLDPTMGYILSEFVLPVSWSLKYDSLVDAAAHQINEGKWMRNREYVEDYIQFWAKQYNPKGCHQYSEAIADAAWAAYGIYGNTAFIKAQQAGLVKNFDGWTTDTGAAGHYEKSVGLYYISPLWDAQEYSCSSVQTSKKFDGGIGYRPSMNSYMYANAIAIANIAKLNGDTATANTFTTKANELRAAIIKYLWDDKRQFFYHMQQENNANHALLDSREEVGFYPFRYNVPDDPKYAIIWEQIRDHSGFNSSYGPTTCEQRSQWYDGKQTRQCCWWNGNSWPYSTSITLGAIANTILHYKQTVATKVDYYNVLASYTKTQHKSGKPYVGECHSPTSDIWTCDGDNHSEHYLHSTFMDNILGELLGIKPRTDNNFEINPLVPDNWNYFAIENLLYHGHEITVQWDKTGDHYKAGAGFKIFVDGKEAASKTAVEHTVVEIPEPKLTARRKVENRAANPLASGNPHATASYTNTASSKVADAIDGRIVYDYVPRNRWDNYNSPNTDDWYAVDFGKEITVDEVRLYIYSDFATGQGSVDCPTAMKVQYHGASGTTFVDVEEQKNTPAKCSPNDLNIITFKAVKAQSVRVVFTRDVEKKHFVGITELEVWTA